MTHGITGYTTGIGTGVSYIHVPVRYISSHFTLVTLISTRLLHSTVNRPGLNMYKINFSVFSIVCHMTPAAHYMQQSV